MSRIALRRTRLSGKSRDGQVELVGGIASMTMSDPLGDMLTRIRTGRGARQAVVASPASKIRSMCLEVLKREGYIRGFTREHVRPGMRASDRAQIFDGEPSSEISRVSKPAGASIRELPITAFL